MKRAAVNCFMSVIYAFEADIRSHTRCRSTPQQSSSGHKNPFQSTSLCESNACMKCSKFSVNELLVSCEREMNLLPEPAKVVTVSVY